jgi:molybdenum cofactor cytidylyltransferase
MTSSVAAVILAAGAATRMGFPKQILPFRGRSLLRHAIDAATAAGLAPIFVVLGAHLERIEPELAGLPARAVLCSNWADGQGASVRAGVRALCDGTNEPDAVVLLLCDQPLLGPDVLRELLAVHTAGADVAASTYAETVGVPALFGRNWFPRLLDLPDSAGAKRLLAAAGDDLRRIPFPGGAFDIDTPMDYDRLCGESEWTHDAYDESEVVVATPDC